jgi:hypothetical protein
VIRVDDVVDQIAGCGSDAERGGAAAICVGYAISFVPQMLAPAAGTYTVTGGTGQASAVITATISVTVNSTLTQFSGTTTLTVQ